MSRSRAAKISTRAVVAVAVPLFVGSAVAGADPGTAPRSSNSADTNGHEWIG